MILVKRPEARVRFVKYEIPSWNHLGWFIFNDIWKVRVLEFQIIIFINYQSLFPFLNIELKIGSKIEILYKRISIMLVLNEKKRRD